jgi:two-component system, NarL family, nitrate/nitrite sensor histidine kinase NarX
MAFTPVRIEPAPHGARMPDMAADAGASSDLETLLERFLVAIIALAGAQAGAVRVLTDDGLHMRLVGQSGLPATVLDSERLVDRDCGVCGIAISSEGVAWVDDVRTCAQAGSQAYFGSQCRRVLAISLTHAGQVLGVYSLFFESDARIDAQTETLLRLIGQLLGLALHNARVERDQLRATILKERQDVINEVHDAIAQTLAFARMRLPLLGDAMQAHDDERSLKYLTDVKKAMGDAHYNLREVMTHFRARMDPLGLLHALQATADAFFDRTGIALEIRNSAPTLDLTDEQEAQVFYIVQEALANIAKHSKAAHAVVAIARTAEHLEFIVEDDGMGLPAPADRSGESESPATHFGLEIMRRRASRLGGTIDVRRNAGVGTLVRLALPATPMHAEARA